MAEWKTRTPRLRQGGQAEDEAVPSWKSSPITEPRLTLPSVPRVAPTLPSARVRRPVQTGQYPAPAKVDYQPGQTGQHPVPSDVKPRAGTTGQYRVPSSAQPRSSATGHYATPASMEPRSRQTGQHPIPSASQARSGRTGHYAAPTAADLRSGVTGQHAFPPPVKPRSGQTGQYPAPTAADHRSGQTGQHSIPSTAKPRSGVTGQYAVPTRADRLAPSDGRPTGQTGQLPTTTGPKYPVPLGTGRATGLIGRYGPPGGADSFARSQPSATQSGRIPAAVQPPSWAWEEEAKAPTAPTKAITLIPGASTEKGSRPRPEKVQRARRGIPPRGQAMIIFSVLSALALGLVFGGVLKNGLEPLVFNFSASTGNAALQPTPAPTLPPGLNTTDTTHYIDKYGFDAPGNVSGLSSAEQQRLTKMMPYALAATARYDARYQEDVEPQMLLWWTHAEGIGARINYSNCANESPPSGSYFVSIQNCDRPDFWQLGYGNQFGNIWILKDAFTDMHGDPDDPKLVQKVGQAVLDYDKSQGTQPTCGGYSCTFPAMTIDQIMADVHWHASDHKETTSNWWASVLSRDPGINSYMLALALRNFSHEQTRTWVGCYYAEPCWQRESNDMWQILDAWKAMGG